MKTCRSHISKTEDVCIWYEIFCVSIQMYNTRNVGKHNRLKKNRLKSIVNLHWIFSCSRKNKLKLKPIANWLFFLNSCLRSRTTYSNSRGMRDVTNSKLFWQTLWHFMLLWTAGIGNQFYKNFHLNQDSSVWCLWTCMWPISTGLYVILAFKDCPIGFGQALAWGGAVQPSSQPVTRCKPAPTRVAWQCWSSLLKGRVHGLGQGPEENVILFQVTPALKRVKNLQMSPRTFRSKQPPFHWAPPPTLPSRSSQPLH